MSVLTIGPGDSFTKDPSDRKVYRIDWSDYLAEGAELIDVGTFTVECLSAPRESPITLEVDEVSLVSGNQIVQFRVSGGRDAGPYTSTKYRVAHRMTTNEDPDNSITKSFLVLVQQC